MARQSKHGTLVAATKATVTLDVKWREVQVDNRGASGDIFFTTNGTDPVSNADDTFVVPPGKSLRVSNARVMQICEVELISAGTPTYSVTGF